MFYPDVISLSKTSIKLEKKKTCERAHWKHSSGSRKPEISAVEKGIPPAPYLKEREKQKEEGQKEGPGKATSWLLQSRVK